ncbi:MAG: type 4 pilus major pilin [Pseudomonas sp.]|uniref:type 4 pilus major pilin n=1 Tax=Pseudomonas sp. TaxID=306 RepID=UPI003BB4C117
MQKQKYVRRGQRGLSLIEASMVLALSAVVVAGAVMYYGTAAESAKVARAQAQLGAIQTAVAGLYGNQSSYVGLDAAALQTSGALPVSYFSGVGAMVNPWNEAVTVAPVIGNRNYAITFTDIPAAACKKIVTSDAGTGVVSVEVGGSTGVSQLTLADANTGCGTTTQTVVYTVR